MDGAGGDCGAGGGGARGGHRGLVGLGDDAAGVDVRGEIVGGGWVGGWGGGGAGGDLVDVEAWGHLVGDFDVFAGLFGLVLHVD